MDRLMLLYGKHTGRKLGAEIIAPNVLRSVQNRPPLVEVKRRIGKSDQRFQLENWSHTQELCVGRWLAPSSSSNVPAGRYSWGVWWKNNVYQNLGAYRIHDSYGNLLAYRLDVLKDVKIEHDAVTREYCLEFSDLVVDLWLWPTFTGGSDDGDGNRVSTEILEITVEDMDELVELVSGSKNQLLPAITDAESEKILQIVQMVQADPAGVTTAVDAAIESAIRQNDYVP